jgi:hypothetical protein
MCQNEQIPEQENAQGGSESGAIGTGGERTGGERPGDSACQKLAYFHASDEDIILAFP